MIDSDFIDAEYRRRCRIDGRSAHGWSFMYSPEARLKTAKAVIVGLNPGGLEPDAPGRWEYTQGENAFVDQDWTDKPGRRTPLQQQVTALLALMKLGPAEVFAANFVPFRSVDWRSLPDAEEALAFGRTLWGEIVRETPAQLFISLGKVAGIEVARLADATLRVEGRHPTGWGGRAQQTIDEFISASGKTVLCLPHPSRFQLFSGRYPEAERIVREVAKRVIAA